MSSPEALPQEQEDPVVPTYTVLCLVALAVIFLVLLQHGFGSWSLSVPLIGGLGLILRWRAAAQLLLLALAAFLLVEGGEVRSWIRIGVLNPVRFPIADFVLCAAVLVYVVAQYRLQSLQHCVFPPDPRRRERTAEKASGLLRLAPKMVQQRRSVQLASPWEIGRLLLALPVWAGLAQLCWWALPAHVEFFDLPRWIVQALLLTWILGLVLFVSVGLLSYVSLRGARPVEAKLFLQDTLWQETRREQRRLNRWMAWSRLRTARTKEML
jgi:hypothetical protein